jgi:hypothetical protein
VEYLKYMPVFRGIYQEIKKSMDLFKVYMGDLGTPLDNFRSFSNSVPDS